MTGVLYFTFFISLFFEVFLLITYFEAKDELKFEEDHGPKTATRFPSVTIIVPCYNEEKTVDATVVSLLSMDYPKEKLSLILVDDGSTDRTPEVLKKYESNPQIKVLSKENGGKHTALNLALEHVESELVGCLDADSFADPQALKNIVPYFDDETIMAVTPSVKVHEPKTILQHIQKVEYGWGIFLRRMLAHMDALYVTPGPLSIFRVKVFKELGGYRKAHNTEDLEMALRMQKNKYRIANSINAHVYTVAPAKLKGLYKQRVRWTFGFINNAIDYRMMYFKKEYGNVGLFILPIASFSIFSTLFAASVFVVHWISKIIKSFETYQAIGWSFHWPHLNFDPFFVSTSLVSILSATMILLSVATLFLALRVAEGKGKPKWDMIYYLTIYMFIVPLWLAGAVYNSLFSRKVSWR